MSRRATATAATAVLAMLLFSGCTAATAPSTTSASPDAPIAAASSVATGGTGAAQAAPTPGSLEKVGDAPTVAKPGEEFAVINVRFIDQGSNPVAGQLVTFTVTSGPAVFQDGVFEATTDESGVASAYSLIAGDTEGAVVITAASVDSTLALDLTVAQ